MNLKEHSEFKKHEGMVINLDLTLQQEHYQSEELEDMTKKK
jgi:hypothetical protein